MRQLVPPFQPSHARATTEALTDARVVTQGHIEVFQGRHLAWMRTTQFMRE